MCQQGRTGAHVRAQNIRRQVGVPSVQFSPVNLSNFTPVLTPRAEECTNYRSAVPLSEGGGIIQAGHGGAQCGLAA